MSKDIISLEFDKQAYKLRGIRSFIRRHNRLTKGQKHALATLWKDIGISYNPQLIDFNTIFGRIAPVTLEIGFGMGTSLVAMATEHSEQNFIGVEVYLPGVGACLTKAKQAGINNLRIIYYDAVKVLEQMIPNASLAKVQIFFPDIWHKTRHNKRRIIQVPFIELVKCKLSVDGIFHVATDWQPYAEHILAVISITNHFHNLSPTGNYMTRPIGRPITKFEQRGQQLGHNIWDLMFKKQQ